MNTALGRPVRPGERPAFGSVWRWRGSDARFVALRLDVRPNDYTLYLIALRAVSNVISNSMVWGNLYLGEPITVPGWFCVMEGIDA